MTCWRGPDDKQIAASVPRRKRSRATYPDSWPSSAWNAAPKPRCSYPSWIANTAQTPTSSPPGGAGQPQVRCSGEFPELRVAIRPAAVIGEVIEFAVPIGVAQTIEPDSQHCPRRCGNPHRREPQPERGNGRFGRGVLIGQRLQWPLVPSLSIQTFTCSPAFIRSVRTSSARTVPPNSH